MVILIFFLIAARRLGDQRLDLLGQLLLLFLEALVTHRFVLGGVGFEFRSVQTDMAQRGQPQFHRQLHGLLEASLKKFSMVFTKVTQHPKVRAVALRDEHKRQILAATPLDLTGTEHASTIGVDQNRHDQLRVIGVLAFATVGLLDARGIQLFKQFAVEKAFMLFRKQIEDVARK